MLVLGRARLPATTDAQTQSADADGVEVGAVLQELKKVRRLDLRVVFSFLRALVNRGGAWDGTGASVRGGRVRCVSAGGVLAITRAMAMAMAMNMGMEGAR